MSDSYIDRWLPWYGVDDTQQPYGDPLTYRVGADFLRGLSVEDWGCGYGWFRSVHEGPYSGIDGTRSRWCDVVADLRQYKSQSEGIWMRGVLEHNPEWPVILDNVCASATDRLVIVVFTPDGGGQEIGFTKELGVPDLAIPWSAVDNALTSHGFVFERHVYVTSSAYGNEVVWLASKQ